MHDKQFMREAALEGAKAFKEGRMDRRTFLVLCGMAGIATQAVIAGDAEAAANEIVMWNWGGQSEECHGKAIGDPFTAETGMAELAGLAREIDAILGANSKLQAVG